MSMAWIRRCVLSEQYRFTRHAGERMRRRQLSRAEVAEVLTGGGIIERDRKSTRLNSSHT